MRLVSPNAVNKWQNPLQWVNQKWGVLTKALKTEKAVLASALRKSWKKAVVIGIPKPGKPRDFPASYRPINLLSILGKLFDKTLKTRLSEYLRDPPDDLIVEVEKLIEVNKMAID
ncbi:hypothetical protein EVAR_40801_1 [Eumeta japonica]|uniref:RNA-directed DNA polymerase from transposon X-element n=1 Tax=Eumeta variegata TaxID=151549 RepID=A0A4C1X2L5_EUMVA|nr:hypothetical protein EVAR_40801_1 [Eumeta japonica]